ncbi:HAD family phosphatase [Candidatus Woesearchaeota archaeon]|nr:HAD family phosphatase [Candidatus Woesearchaeota archaeon]
MIKAVITDVGGVMMTTILRHMAADLAEKHSLDKNFVNKAIHRRWTDYKLDKITGDEFWQGFVEETGIDENVEELKKESLSYNRIIPGAFDVYKSLKGKYKLAVLSNNAEEWVEEIKKLLPIDDVFDVVLFSNEVKMKKPDAEFFMLCAKKLGFKPEECVFVDDQENNITAAEELGFKTIKFTDAEQLKSELKNMGVSK